MRESKALLAFNILAGGIVFLFMLALSYTHTEEFFARGGYHGKLAHIGVIACELLFFLSNTNIIICKLKGWKVPVPIRISSVVGAGVVGYANISSGFNHGIESIGIGALILVVLVVSELVVSAAIMSAKADSNAGQTDKKSDRRPDIVSDKTDNGQNGHYYSDKQPDAVTDKRTDTRTLAKAENKSDMQADNNADSLPDADISADTLAAEYFAPSKTDNESDKRTDSRTNNGHFGQSDITSDTKSDTADTTDNKPDTSDKRTGKTDTAKKSDKTTRQTNKKSDTKTDNLTEHPVVVAERLKKELGGKYPSIRRLAAEAGISKHKADKILKELKAKDKAQAS